MNTRPIPTIRSTTPNARVNSIERLAGSAVSGASGATVTAGSASAPAVLRGKAVEVGGKIGDVAAGVVSRVGIRLGAGPLGEDTPIGSAPAVVAVARDPGVVDVT